MAPQSVRTPAVAGQFYAGSETALREQIEGCYRHRLGPGQLPEVNENGPREIIGLVSPHAGYPYSGPPAACGYYELAADGRPQVIIIIGPSHQPVRIGAAIQTTGAWATPLGEAVIDSEVATAVAEDCSVLEDSAAAFSYEHSLEVQLPFLQHLYGASVRFVPIMMVDQEWETAAPIGDSLATVLEGRDAVIIASTDMTHYEPAQVAREQDMLLVQHIEKLDAEGMLQTRARRHISMCGYGPTAAMMIAATTLGARHGQLIAYSTSGDVQPMPTVVGYVSAKVTG